MFSHLHLYTDLPQYIKPNTDSFMKKCASALKPTEWEIFLFSVILTEFLKSHSEMCNNSFTAVDRVQSRIRIC
jgi:hypothetical protein